MCPFDPLERLRYQHARPDGRLVPCSFVCLAYRGEVMLES